MGNHQQTKAPLGVQLSSGTNSRPSGDTTVRPRTQPSVRGHSRLSADTAVFSETQPSVRGHSRLFGDNQSPFADTAVSSGTQPSVRGHNRLYGDTNCHGVSNTLRPMTSCSGSPCQPTLPHQLQREPLTVVGLRPSQMALCSRTGKLHS